MTLPAVLYVLWVQARDTFAQARAAGITAGLLAVTAVCTLFCLALGVTGDTAPLPTRPWEQADFLPRQDAERQGLTADQVRENGVDVPSGELRFLFGAVRVPMQRQRGDAVRLIQLVLAGGVADSAGLILCLLWTAGFLPAFLDPAAARVLVAKPVPRGLLLAGKAAGVVAAVALQAFIFVAATWLALGIRTGVWDVDYFTAVPLATLHFAIGFGVSAVIAVFTRSATACALGTLAVWLACFGVNLARHDMALRPEGAPVALEAAYWMLPKPADYNLMLAKALGAKDYVSPVVDELALTERGALNLPLSVLTGVGAAGGLLVAAGRRFARTDY